MREKIQFRSSFQSKNYTSRQTAEAAIRGSKIVPKPLVITKKQVLERIRGMDEKKKDEYLSFVLGKVKNKYKYLESLKNISFSQTYEGDDLYPYIGKYFYNLYGFRHKLDEYEEENIKTGKISYNEFAIVAERHLNTAMLTIKETMFGEGDVLSEEFDILTEDSTSAFSKTFRIQDMVYKLYYFNKYTDELCLKYPMQRNPRRSFENEINAMNRLKNYDFVLVGERSYSYNDDISVISYPVGFPINDYGKHIKVVDLEKILSKLHSIDWYHGDLNLGNFVWYNDTLRLIDFEYSGSGDYSKIQEDLNTLEEISERVGNDSIITYLREERRRERERNFNQTKKIYDSDSDNESLKSTTKNLFD